MQSTEGWIRVKIRVSFGSLCIGLALHSLGGLPVVPIEWAEPPPPPPPFSTFLSNTYSKLEKDKNKI